ncbi:hypothetical protein M378DRAFT_173952, partial [Amanita muscaria Koide BX008]
LGPALRALHYLEESLKLGTLVPDSTNDRRAIVQLFIEVKRHPSQPSLAGWCAAIEEGSRSYYAGYVIANRSHPPTCRRSTCWITPNAFGTEIAYAAELALQEENDQRTIALLKIGLVLYRLS